MASIMKSLVRFWLQKILFNSHYYRDIIENSHCWIWWSRWLRSQREWFKLQSHTMKSLKALQTRFISL